MSDRAASVVEVAGSVMLIVAASMVASAFGFAVAGGLCWLYAWRSTR